MKTFKPPKVFNTTVIPIPYLRSGTIDVSFQKLDSGRIRITSDNHWRIVDADAARDEWRNLLGKGYVRMQ